MSGSVGPTGRLRPQADPPMERPWAEAPPHGVIGLMSRTTEDLRSRHGG